MLLLELELEPIDDEPMLLLELELELTLLLELELELELTLLLVLALLLEVLLEVADVVDLLLDDVLRDTVGVLVSGVLAELEVLVLLGRLYVEPDCTERLTWLELLPEVTGWRVDVDVRLLVAGVTLLTDELGVVATLRLVVLELLALALRLLELGVVETLRLFELEALLMLRLALELPAATDLEGVPTLLLDEEP